MDTYKRISGGMFGIAVGDALGATLEFMTQEEIKEKYGCLKDIIGGGAWNLKPGEVTDDTMMTIAVAQGIVDNPNNPTEAIGRRFMEWFETNPKDVGNIINIALSEYKISGDWTRAAHFAHVQTGGRSAGNGSLMRCLPIALAYPNIKEMVQFTIAQSSLTHFDDKTAQACVFYNKLVSEYLNGQAKIPPIRKLVKEYTYYGDVFKLEKTELKPTGYVVDTLVCSLWCFINTASFEDAVWEAANLGGDADTIAAIAGGLAGVYYGYDEIPKRWKDKIILKDKLYDLAKKANEIRQGKSYI